ncbi:hypothetical protein TPELB_23560 [Terrisporobacter petrolearius]|uniref:Phage gp6-like head-tail connector protein n=1 Tax=Terrisporobacter petrolearius TaxID=1460447 RepID=A0ABZ3FGF0_9FIRM
MIKEVKNYLKIDEDAVDSEVESLIQAAKIFIKNTGVTITEILEQNELYILAIKILVTHWHENREPVGKADTLPFSLTSIIVQLKYCEV